MDDFHLIVGIVPQKQTFYCKICAEASSILTLIELQANFGAGRALAPFPRA
jgi:hypothetical protein